MPSATLFVCLREREREAAQSQFSVCSLWQPGRDMLAVSFVVVWLFHFYTSPAWLKVAGETSSRRILVCSAAASVLKRLVAAALQALQSKSKSLTWQARTLWLWVAEENRVVEAARESFGCGSKICTNRIELWQMAPCFILIRTHFEEFEGVNV